MFRAIVKQYHCRNTRMTSVCSSAARGTPHFMWVGILFLSKNKKIIIWKTFFVETSHSLDIDFLLLIIHMIHKSSSIFTFQALSQENEVVTAAFIQCTRDWRWMTNSGVLLAEKTPTLGCGSGALSQFEKKSYNMIMFLEDRTAFCIFRDCFRYWDCFVNLKTVKSTAGCGRCPEIHKHTTCPSGHVCYSAPPPQINKNGCAAIVCERGVLQVTWTSQS